MKGKILIVILSLFLVNAVFSQNSLIETSNSIKEQFNRLPEIGNNNFKLKIVTKNGKPYKKVEISANGQLLGTSNDFGNFTDKLNKSGKINFLFKKGGKQFTKTIDFSADSIYSLNLKLHKPEYTTFSISSKPYDTLVWEKLKNTDNFQLMSVFIFRFPNSIYKKEAENRIEEIFYNNAIKENLLNSDKILIITDFVEITIY